jgi:hypothetical protein
MIPCSPGPPFLLTGFTDSGHDIGVQARNQIVDLQAAYPPWPAVKGGPGRQGIEVVARGARLLTWKDASFQNHCRAPREKTSIPCSPGPPFPSTASQTATPNAYVLGVKVQAQSIRLINGKSGGLAPVDPTSHMQGGMHIRTVTDPAQKAVAFGRRQNLYPRDGTSSRLYLFRHRNSRDGIYTAKKKPYHEGEGSFGAVPSSTG